MPKISLQWIDGEPFPSIILMSSWNMLTKWNAKRIFHRWLYFNKTLQKHINDVSHEVGNHRDLRMIHRLWDHLLYLELESLLVCSVQTKSRGNIHQWNVQTWKTKHYKFTIKCNVRNERKPKESIAQSRSIIQMLKPDLSSSQCCTS